MKYLKTFEGREENYRGKKIEYKYLTSEEEKLLTDFITDYVKNLNILDKVDSLTLSDLEDDSFEYRTIFNNFVGMNNSFTDSNSFYRNVDNFIKSNNINSNPRFNRNSVYKIEDKIYKYYKPELTEKLDDKIIELVSNITDLTKFKNYYRKYSDKFNNKVKNAFDFIFNADKFNL